jgi:hypothetical protein
VDYEWGNRTCKKKRPPLDSGCPEIPDGIFRIALSFINSGAPKATRMGSGACAIKTPEQEGLYDGPINKVRRCILGYSHASQLVLGIRYPVVSRNIPVLGLP